MDIPVYDEDLNPIYYLESVLKAKTKATATPEELDDFTGPLDLILHLLSKNKMEIKDIQLSLILEQYLLWMSKRQALDLEIASEFVTMASHLVDIKTRMLLSVHDTEANEEMDELIATLEAHRNNETYLAIKKITPNFIIQFSHGQNLLTRPPEVLEKQKEFIYNHDRKELYKAMHNVVTRIDGKKTVQTEAFQKIVGKEPYPVPQKAIEIVNFLVLQGANRFTILIAQCRTKSEAVATFIAVLDLCKNNRITISIDDECILKYIDPETKTVDDDSPSEQESSEREEDNP